MSELASQEPAAATAPATCRWEYEDGQRCARPPAPRRGTRGPAPVYCEQADEPGQPVHNPLNAWRAKTRPAGVADDEDPQAGRAPVAEAIRTAGSTLDRAEQLAAALRETAEHLAEALATAADPDAAAAQISARRSPTPTTPGRRPSPWPRGRRRPGSQAEARAERSPADGRGDGRASRIGPGRRGSCPR